MGHGATIGVYIIRPPFGHIGVEFREHTGLAVRIRLLTTRHTTLVRLAGTSLWILCSWGCPSTIPLGHVLRGSTTCMLVDNTCHPAHGVHVIGGFHTPNLVSDLGDDIIGPPCEYPVDHAYSTMLILVLGRIMRSSIIQASGSIHGPNPMTIVIAVVSWCESMHPIPD